MYSAWFRDTKFPPDDQDYEWVAVFIVEANSESDALEWGDHLSKNYSSRYEDQQFYKSGIGHPSEYVDCLGFNDTPKVKYGQMPTDEYVGW